MQHLSEDDEQTLLVDWLRLRNYHFFRVPNETYTTSWSQKRKNQRLGVSKGVPDIFIFKNGKKWAIELKSKRPGAKASPEQLQWLKLLAAHGFEAAVCHGHDECIKFLEGRV